MSSSVENEGGEPSSAKNLENCLDSGLTGQPLTKRQKIEIMKSIQSDGQPAVKLPEDYQTRLDFISSGKADLDIRNSCGTSTHTSCSVPSEMISSILNAAKDESTQAAKIKDREPNRSIIDEVDHAVGTQQQDFMFTAQVSQTELVNTVKTIHMDEMLEFELSLAKQCLCGVPERRLRKPFQSHYSLDTNGQQKIANISEWPSDKIIQLLSNLQLLFEIYLRQNSKGFICSRIVDVCDAIVRDDYHLIDEIITLSNHANNYVQFLASRVISAFLIIAKQDLKENWLEEIVDNSTNFKQISEHNVQKTNFSLAIIRRIIEWKDIELHPLEEIQSEPYEEHNEYSEDSATTDPLTHGHILFETQPATLENNYFARYFNSDELSDLDVAERSRVQSTKGQSVQSRNTQPNTPPSYLFQGCHFHALTDSESFDTTQLKSIVIKRLAIKWPVLLQSVSVLISVQFEYAEDCVINFLHLWESITSVKANLPVSETLPFYAKMDKFVRLLFAATPNTIYKQMLCLFNEALCYGSTLALQDVLPEEPCELARIVVKYAKDGRIFEDLPRSLPENIVGLIGFRERTIVYDDGSLQSKASTNLEPADAKVDRTVLQKIVLLVLKSIAIIVKEIRSDSSDSSIDSSDYDALQDMKMIVRLISEAISKLEIFMKSRLSFHSQSHFSTVLVHLFKDQDDFLIEALVCTLDVATGISIPNGTYDELVWKLNPAYSFIEFIKLNNDSDWLLDYLVNNETCFLLYLLRILKYITSRWNNFELWCQQIGLGQNTLDEVMGILKKLQDTIQSLVKRQLFPYNIDPVLGLLKKCASLHERSPL